MSSSLEKIRLLALPLTRNTHPTSEKRPINTLIYFYAHRIPQAPPESAPAASLFSRTIAKPPLLVSKQWSKLGAAPVGSLKRKVHTLGERMMDKIPFEEWALKTIDPALIPKTLDVFKSPNNLPSTPNQKGTVTVLYPRLPGLETNLIRHLSESMIDRQPFHRKWMKLNIILSSFTLPFALIPFIPNLPFFYMMWRSWSHWRAFKASSYLNQLINQGNVIATPSALLDEIYSSKLCPVFSDPSEDRLLASNARDPATNHWNQDSGELILTEEMVVRIKESFELPDESQPEICRAIVQARQRLSKPSQP